ncbi:hypothetical protein N566_02365 [Streptomycetaceae bacterium MP113-05]|nr:hypothetical protein N566_02365 [Streptomycetaceae bacterium MP113-05]
MSFVAWSRPASSISDRRPLLTFVHFSAMGVGGGVETPPPTDPLLRTIDADQRITQSGPGAGD